MPIEMLLIIIATISAAGLVTNTMRRPGNNTHIFTVAGSRAHVILFGVAIWVIAFGAVTGAASILWAIAPPVMAIPITFTLLALALEFCTSRVTYQVESPAFRTINLTHNH